MLFCDYFCYSFYYAFMQSEAGSGETDGNGYSWEDNQREKSFKDSHESTATSFCWSQQRTCQGKISHYYCIIFFYLIDTKFCLKIIFVGYCSSFIEIDTCYTLVPVAHPVGKPQKFFCC